ncbi:Toll/interleukin-1 receptor domain-containing protein [Tanacetum coccineum]|uniref:Toll/interleukin-1 receptor domain-containing protein n=1 Tax=Tanacetum coccineum TaxID=301880 RepID=A0ABQ5EEX2_9ASTR
MLEVWDRVKGYAGLDSSNPNIYDIISDLIPIARRRLMLSIVAKLVVAALTYYIWQERNWRLFKKAKRNPNQICECIRASVRFKLMSCKFKKSRSGVRMAQLWELPEAIFGNVLIWFNPVRIQFSDIGVDRLKSRNNVSLRWESSGPKDNNPYSQIDAHTCTLGEHAVATDNFSPNCFLGEGGFGSVYRGRLPWYWSGATSSSNGITTPPPIILLGFKRGLRLPPDQIQITSALPAHLVDVPPVGDSAQTVSEISGMYMKNTPPMITNVVSNQGALMQYVYDVFLSFRGEDTRKTFVDHLYTALEQRHIRTYKDDITLPRGESVGPALLKAIQDSSHAADNGKNVMPVFYAVDPFDVRKQKGDSGKRISKQLAENTQGQTYGEKNYIDEGLFGMRARLQDLISQLKIGSDGVRMVGIWGLGGGGKTTLATSVYMEIIRHFKSHCIIRIFREESREICDSDDVDHLDQLEALAGSPNWFGDGSRIIITTRDEHLLRKHKVDHVSPVRLLADDEAIELFRSHAFNEEKHIKDYEIFSLQVVSYADGLPLALKVLGSFLYDKDAEEWMSTMDRLRDIPERKWKSDAMEIFDACGFHPEIGIKVLIQKSLITIDSYGRFGMHDLIQEMGHYIVRGEHPNNPEKHSRVWKHAEVSNMCFGDATVENDQIEAIKFGHDIHRPQVIMLISKMKKLRWLRLRSWNNEAPNCLSNELRYIDWNHYPASPFPDSFQATNLVFLILNESKQKLLWKGYKHLPQLKVLQLQRMKRLVSTPDFNGLPRLQKLFIFNCKALEEMHPSLGNHRSLKYVHVQNCSKLRMFPTIVRMEQLESLHISFCHKSLVFPKIQANMECLVKLDVCHCHIQIDALLSSIGERCTNLISLRLEEFRGSKGPGKTPFAFRLTHNLRKLNLSECFFEDGEIQSDICELSNLQVLNLSYNKFSKLHFSLSQLTRLKLLNLFGCKRLVKLPELPSSIAIIIADECDKLTSIGDLSENCKWLCYISLDQSMVIDGNKLLQSMLKGNAIEHQSMLLRIRRLEIPKQFINRLYAGNKCRLPLPENWCNDFYGFLICVVVDGCDDLWSSPDITITEEASDDMRGMFHDVVWGESFGGKLTWVWYVSFASLRCTEWWNPTHKNVSFYIHHYNTKPSNYLGIGASLVPMNNGGGLTDTSTDSSEFTDDYTHKISISHDSKSSLTISPRVYAMADERFSMGCCTK